MTQHDATDVLLKAASIVEEGWCQYVFHTNGDGQWATTRDKASKSCAAGALSRAASELDANERDSQHAYMALAMHVGGMVTDWNDKDGRTAEEVAEAMRNAADRYADLKTKWEKS